MGNLKDALLKQAHARPISTPTGEQGYVRYAILRDSEVLGQHIQLAIYGSDDLYIIRRISSNALSIAKLSDNSDAMYTVTRGPRGAYSCTCPNEYWRKRGRNRPCKHIRWAEWLWMDI